MFFLGLAGGVFLLDWGIKELIEGMKDSEFPIEVKKTGGKVFLYKNHNAGFSFGYLKEYPQLVCMIPLVVLSALAGALAWVLSKKGYLTEKIALGLVLGGGLSNFYDRIKKKYVVDYININWHFLKKVVFNLGDLFIVLGVVIITIKELIRLVLGKNS